LVLWHVLRCGEAGRENVCWLGSGDVQGYFKDGRVVVFPYAKEDPTMTIAEGIEEQAEQCLRNISAALEQAGSGLQDIVRVIDVVPHGPDFPAIFPVLRKHLGQVRPAAMMISAGLSDPRMRLEIQVTARRGSGA
jgi:enamine deaminase RidA (YjgF/YER057c/UK114 family)